MYLNQKKKIEKIFKIMEGVGISITSKTLSSINFLVILLLILVKYLHISNYYCIFAPALLLSNTSRQVLYISRFIEKGALNRMKVPKPTVENKGYTEGQR